MAIQKDIENAKIDIIKEFGIDKLEQGKQDAILMQMGEIMQQRIIERFISELAEDKQEQFLALISNEETNQEAVDIFVAENLPQSDELILEEIGKYKEESIQMFNQIASEK